MRERFRPDDRFTAARTSWPIFAHCRAVRTKPAASSGLPGAIVEITLRAEPHPTQDAALEIMGGGFPAQFFLQDLMENLERARSVDEGCPGSATIGRRERGLVAIAVFVYLQAEKPGASPQEKSSNCRIVTCDLRGSLRHAAIVSATRSSRSKIPSSAAASAARFQKAFVPL